jgi:hypothetical protein
MVTDAMTDQAQRTEGGGELHTALLPRGVRRWVLTGLGAGLASALYLISVRGTAILFDLGAAIGAICF